MEPQTQTQTQEQQPQPKDPVAAALERLGPQHDEAKQQLDAINLRVKAFVKENPGTALLGAIAVGFVVGRLVSKK
jgi:ElaB/YqjD/DUF883 family membrane-anchored ribosome-binding protein